MNGAIGHLPAGAELTDEASFRALHSCEAGQPASRAPLRPSTPPSHDVAWAEVTAIARRPAGNARARRPAAPSPSGAAALETELDLCRSPKHAARLAVHLARAYASAVVCFVVVRGAAQGEYAEGLDEGLRVEGTLFPVAASGTFSRVARGEGPYRGSPPEDAVGRRVLRALGRDLVSEVALLPIALRGRVIALLYADNGPELLGDASAAALGSVCERVARTCERLVLERKRG